MKRLNSQELFRLMDMVGFTRVEGQDDHSRDSTTFTLTDGEGRISVFAVTTMELEECGSELALTAMLLDRHLRQVDGPSRVTPPARS
jgi:hypothetical protein